MRRLWASVALAFFVVVPVLQWHCVLACAGDDDAPAVVTCAHHGPVLATPVVQDHHDCEYQTSPALLAPSAAYDVQFHATLRAEPAALISASAATTSVVTLAIKPLGWSPGCSALPLRV